MDARLRSRRAWLLAVAALAAVLTTVGTAALVPASRASGTSDPAIAGCAFGSGVPGLQGYLPAAVSSAADRYAATVTAADRARARSVFTAAAAAYAYGFPQVDERETVKHLPRNALVSIAALANPSVQTVISPNADTAYTVSWLDLTSGPMVINVPDTGGRFYTFQLLDAFTNDFAYIGSGSTGTAAGAYEVVPPGYAGATPAGLTRINAPSNTVWLLGRTVVKDAADVTAVKALQQHYELTSLAAWEAGGRQPPVVLDNYPPTIPKSIPTGAEFIATLNRDMTIDPPPAADACALRAMAPAGVQIAHPTFAQTLAADLANQAPPLPPAASDPVADAGISAGTTAAARIVAAGALALNGALRSNDNGWEILGPWVGAYDTRYLGRSIVAADLLAANTPPEQLYPLADTDSTGLTLDGSHRYTIHFTKGELPPVKAFWSLTMYDADRFLAPNAIGRYAVGDRGPGLRYGRDGSLTISIQHDAPGSAAARADWLPAPEGQFHLILRLYRPEASVLSGGWKPPPVIRVAGAARPGGGRRGPSARRVISRLRIVPRAFRAAGSGGIVVRRHGRARVSYTDSGAGVIRFTILSTRHRRGCRGRRCTVSAVVARFTRRDRAGRNRVSLSGRAAGRRLAPGAYVLRAVAAGSRGLSTGRTVSVGFRIRPALPASRRRRRLSSDNA